MAKGVTLTGASYFEYVKGKTGIIYFEDYAPRSGESRDHGPRSGDHSHSIKNLGYIAPTNPTDATTHKIIVPKLKLANK